MATDFGHFGQWAATDLITALVPDFVTDPCSFSFER